MRSSLIFILVSYAVMRYEIIAGKLIVILI